MNSRNGRLIVVTVQQAGRRVGGNFYREVGIQEAPSPYLVGKIDNAPEDGRLTSVEIQPTPDQQTFIRRAIEAERIE